MPLGLLNSRPDTHKPHVEVFRRPGTVSPLVDFTSNSPSPISKMETSKVPAAES